MIGSFTSLSGSFETMVFTNNVIKNNIMLRVYRSGLFINRKNAGKFYSFVGRWLYKDHTEKSNQIISKIKNEFPGKTNTPYRIDEDFDHFFFFIQTSKTLIKSYWIPIL